MCSGVYSRQEVIEFPLLRTSISTPAGNPPEMKYSGGVYVCFVVRTEKEKKKKERNKEEKSVTNRVSRVQ